LQAAVSAHERELGVVQALAERGTLAQQKAAEASEFADVCEEASKFLAQFADERQAQVIEAIQDIASRGLTQIFGEPMELRIEQVVRARRVEMDIMVKTGELVTPILESRGGGLAAVAGFLLRVAVLLLTPNVRKFMALDETFAMLSEDYLENMGNFLRELCEQTGLQMLMVSHQTEFADAADAVIRIEKSATNTSKLIRER
jgi:DNA repair exonuclease SbcCD ATPase subunit